MTDLLVYSDEAYPVYTLTDEGRKALPPSFVERYEKACHDYGVMQRALASLNRSHRNGYAWCECWRCKRTAVPENPQPLPYEEYDR